jgi:hypothetical protein
VHAGIVHDVNVTPSVVERGSKAVRAFSFWRPATRLASRRSKSLRGSAGWYLSQPTPGGYPMTSPTEIVA